MITFYPLKMGYNQEKLLKIYLTMKIKAKVNPDLGIFLITLIQSNKVIKITKYSKKITVI